MNITGAREVVIGNLSYLLRKLIGQRDGLKVLLDLQNFVKSLYDSHGQQNFKVRAFA